MSRRAHRATLNVVVVALATLSLMLGSGLPVSPASAAEPKRPQKQTKKHAAKRYGKKRITLGLRVVQIANKLTGTPYSWGGASPRAGFDCSGLVQYVYARVGIDLPHHAASQYSRGRRIARGALRPGDLVFFSGLGHVGIYAGRGKFIHAPRRGTRVRWSRLSSHGRYYGARRIVSA
jgi:cell wall-associated NlpC family hydrolase